MNALDLLADGFPHATVAGYHSGCRGSHCPGAMPCRDVAIRYAGDFAFKRQIDSGMTVAEVLSLESEVEDRERQAELERRRVASEGRRAARGAPAVVDLRREPLVQAVRVARAALRNAEHVLARFDQRVARMRVRTVRSWTEADSAALIEMNSQRMSDNAIAKAMGRSQGLVSAKRRALGLEPTAKRGRPRKDAA